MEPSASASRLKVISSRQLESLSRAKAQVSQQYGYESGREPTHHYTSSTHNLSRNGLMNDHSDRELTVRLQGVHAQYASDAGLPQREEATYSQQRKKAVPLYGLASQGRLSTTKRKFVNPLQVVKESGSSLPRIRNTFERECCGPKPEASVAVKSKLRKKFDKLERAPPIHREQAHASTRKHTTQGSSELIYYEDGRGNLRAYGANAGLSSNGARRRQRDDQKLNLTKDRSMRRLVDSHHTDQGRPENQKDPFESTRRGPMSRNEHPAYSTDLDAQEAQANQRKKHPRHLKPVYQAEEFETDDELHKGDNDPHSDQRVYFHIQENGRLHRRVLDSRDDKGSWMYPSISKPTKQAIESLERVYAPIKNCQHNIRDCPHCSGPAYPQLDQSTLSRGTPGGNRQASGLKLKPVHQRQQYEAMNNTTLPAANRSRLRIEDDGQVLALSPTPLKNVPTLKKSLNQNYFQESFAKRDASKPSPQNPPPKYNIHNHHHEKNNSQPKKVPAKYVNNAPVPRHRRNMKDFVQEYENQAHRQLNLRKNIVKHTLMQAHNFVKKTKNPSQHNTAQPNQMKQQILNQSFQSDAFDVNRERQMEKAESQPGSNAEHGTQQVQQASKASGRKVALERSGKTVARGSMSNSSIQNIDPSPHGASKIKFELQRPERNEQLMSDQENSNQIIRTPRDLAKGVRTNSQYSEGHAIYLRSEEKGGKTGAKTAFGSKKMSQRTNQAGPYNLGNLEQNLKVSDQRQAQQQSVNHNQHTVLTPDRQARDAPSGLQNNQPRLSQTPNDYTKNIQSIKERNNMAEIRQSRDMREGSLFHTRGPSPEQSTINIESGSVHFVKGESKKSTKDRQPAAVEERVVPVSSVARRRVSNNASKTQKLLNQFQAAQAQKHKERLQGGGHSVNRDEDRIPSPVDNIYFKEEPIEVMRDLKPGSFRDVGMPKQRSYPNPNHSFSPSTIQGKGRFRKPESMPVNQAALAGSKLQYASARKYKRPTNLFDKYQNTYGKDMVSPWNRRDSNGHLGSRRRSAQKSASKSRGASHERSNDLQKSKRLSQQRASKTSEAKLSLHRQLKQVDSQRALNQLQHANLRNLHVVQSQNQIRSNTISPRHNNASHVHLQEQGQVVQFNKNDWKNESLMKFQKVSSDGRMASGSRHTPDLVRRESSFGRQDKSKTGASRISQNSKKTKHSQATVKLSKAAGSRQSQRNGLSNRSSRRELTPGQREIQDGQARNGIRSSARGTQRDDQVEESAYVDDYQNQEEASNTEPPSKILEPIPLDPKEGANTSQTHQSKRASGYKFEHQPNSTHVSGTTEDGVRITDLKMLDKRNSAHAQTLAGASLAKQKMQYNSFHMKGRATLSKNPSQASNRQNESHGRLKNSGAKQDSQRQSHSQYQAGGILKQSSSHGDDMSPIGKRGSPDAFGARVSIARGSSSTKKSKQDDLLERLTKNNDDVPKSLCSGSHNPEVLKEKAKVRFKLEQEEKRSRKGSSRSRQSSKKKLRPKMVDRAASPIRSEHSIEEVNIEEVAREVREAANDPIVFPVETVETQTSAADTKQKKVKEKEERKTLEELAAERDWAQSGIYQFVRKMSLLPEKGRLQKERALEQAFFNPMQLEILTEEEARYNATLLKRRATSHRGTEQEPETNHDAEFREDLYLRAHNTVELLSDHLFVAQAATFDTDVRQHMKMESQDLKDVNQALGTIEGSQGSAGGAEKQKWQEVLNRKRSLVIKGQHYRNVDASTVIKLLLRCANLYQAYNDIKKILCMVRQEEELFQGSDEDGQSESGNLGTIHTIILDLENQESEQKVLTKDNEQTLVNAVKLLRKLSRAISQFLRDHRIFKQFTYKTNEYQSNLDQQAEAINAFLRSPALVPVPQSAEHEAKTGSQDEKERRLDDQQGASLDAQEEDQIKDAEISRGEVTFEKQMSSLVESNANQDIEKLTQQQIPKKSVQFDVRKNEEIRQPMASNSTNDETRLIKSTNQPNNDVQRQELSKQLVTVSADTSRKARLAAGPTAVGQDYVDDDNSVSKRNGSNIEGPPIKMAGPQYETIEELNNSIQSVGGAGGVPPAVAQPHMRP